MSRPGPLRDPAARPVGEPTDGRWRRACGALAVVLVSGAWGAFDAGARATDGAPSGTPRAPAEALPAAAARTRSPGDTPGAAADATRLPIEQSAQAGESLTRPGAEAAAGPVANPDAQQLAAGPVSVVRPSLLPLVEPLWSDLSPAQRAALAPFEPEWNAWPIPEKKSWVALADRLPRMSAAKRETAQRRIREWAKLTPEQRRLARANFRLAKERPADARVTEWQNYQSMTQEQRTVLRQVGSTSNTAAGHARAPTGLAKEASQPLPRRADPARQWGLVPASSQPRPSGTH
ncbi:MAG: DUF3106 domain-containing protein [Lautropia sp.]